MLAPAVWTITDRSNPNFCTPSHFSGFSGTICGHMRASRLMRWVHDRGRLTDWELLLIGRICWGSGLVPIQPLLGLFLDLQPQLNLYYMGSNASNTVSVFGIVNFWLVQRFNWACRMKFWLFVWFCRNQRCREKRKFGKVVAIDPFPGSHFPGPWEWDRDDSGWK